MPRYPEQFVHQVQQATDIVDLIGQYVSIKRKGKDYVGLCPFHQEKTPSFSVSPTKQIYKCFGCGKAGGAFQFVMEHQKVSFVEAVALLAERAGIPLPQDNAAGGGDQTLGRSELVRVMQFAQEFFRAQLAAPAGAAALEYARKRRLADASLERFGVGYAPDTWDALARAARQQGFSDRQLLAVGLVAPREQGGCYDRFRNRLMLPIIDVGGRIIAFGGRALAADERAKYLNSPETVLFDKSSNLYGMHWARQAISHGGQAIVVEGYFDAIMPAQAGVENVVATLGTSLTDRHVRMLSRLATDVVLVFDSDAAGAAAAERGLELFIAQQVNVRVAAVPEGKDPCDFVLAAGAEAFRQLVADAPDALEYVWRRRSAAVAAGANPVERAKAAEDFLRLIATSAAYGAIDVVRQGFLVNHLAHVLRMPADEISQAMRRLGRRVATASGAAAPGPDALAGPWSGPANQQRFVLEVLLAEPDHFEHVARHVGPEDFTDPRLVGLARHVWRLGNDGDLRLESLLALEHDDPRWGAFVTNLALAGQARGNQEATLGSALDALEAHRRRGELRGMRHQATAGPGDDAMLRSLAEQLRQPDPVRRPRLS